MSGLTVPYAPASPGRSADTRVQGSDAGAALAEFGDRIKAAGDRIEGDRLDRQMSRLQVDMTRDMGNLRLRVEEIGDPDQADAAWSDGMRELRSSYLEGADEAGRPRVDRKNAERFGLALDDLANKHALALGGRNIALRQSQRAATYFQYEQVAGQEAARADIGTRDQLYANFDAETDKQVSAGVMTPEAGAQKKAAFRETTENAAVINQIDQDPEGAIEDLDGGEFKALPPDVQARYRTQATGELERRRAAAARQAEVAKKERDLALDKRLDDIIDIAGANRTAVDETWLNSAEVQARPKGREAAAAIALREERADWQFLTVKDLDTLIAEEKKKPVTAAYQTERLKVLQQRRDAAETGLARDPIDYARRNGFAVPALPALDIADPEAFAAAVGQRVTFGKHLVDQEYVDRNAGTPVFDLAEAASVKQALSIEKDPAQRAAAAGALQGAIRAAGGKPGWLADVTDDRVLATVGTFISIGGSSALASEVLKGEQVIEADNIIMPPLKDRQGAFFAQIGPIFAEMPDGPQLQNDMTAAADSLYAARQRKVDPTGDFAEDTYKQALHEVMGGTGRFDSDRATGGVRTINGRLTAMPMGLSASAVDQARRGLIADSSTSSIAQQRGRGVKASRAEEAIRAASLSGGMPMIGDQPMTRDDWEDAQFIAVGPDNFRVVIPSQSGPLYVTDNGRTDVPFTLSLRKLARAYR